MKSLPMLPLSSLHQPHQQPRQQPEPESYQQQPTQPEQESRRPSLLKRLASLLKRLLRKGAKELFMMFLKQACCIIIQKVLIVLLVLGLLVGLAMLIAFLILKPKPLIYSVQAASIQHLSIGNYQDDHINATFNYMIKSYNQEKYLSARHYSMFISTVHQNQSVAYIDMSTSEQSPKSEKMIETKLVSYKVALSKINGKILRDEKSKGVIEMKVHITSRVRYRKWIFLSRLRKFAAVCEPIMIKVASSSNEGFKEVLCQTL